MRSSIARIALALAVLASLGLGNSAQATDSPRYRVIDLGTLDIDGLPIAAVVAEDINERGQIVGFSTVITPEDDEVGHAFVWSHGQMTDLGTLGGRSSEANAINQRGVVVGKSSLAGDQETHAFILKRGQLTDIGAVVAAYDINNLKQVVASRRNASGTDEGFLWSDGVLTNLGSLEGLTTLPTAVNDSTQVVGRSDVLFTGGGTLAHAFLWEDGEMTDLGAFAGSAGPSFATDINNAGEIVGLASTPTNAGHAFLWRDGGMTDLGVLPSGDFSVAYGINGQDQVVGAAGAVIDGINVIHPFLWSDGKMLDLNALIPAASGWELVEAFAINDGGRIVGTGLLDGEQRAFLLIPTG